MLLIRNNKVSIQSILRNNKVSIQRRVKSKKSLFCYVHIIRLFFLSYFLVKLLKTSSYKLMIFTKISYFLKGTP